jgi:hypothetical protein
MPDYRPRDPVASKIVAQLYGDDEPSSAEQDRILLRAAKAAYDLHRSQALKQRGYRPPAWLTCSAQEQADWIEIARAVREAL